MTWVAVGVGGAALVGTIGGAMISSDASKGAANTQAAGSRAAADEQAREFTLTQSQTAPYRQAGVSAIGQLRAALGMPDPNVSGAPVMYQGQQFGSIDDFRKALVDDAVSKGEDINSPRYQTTLQGVLDKATPVSTPGSPSGPQNSDLLRKFSVSDFWNDPVVQASYQSGLDLGTKALKNAAPLTTGLDSGAALKELTKFGTDYTGNMAAGSQARFVNDQGNEFNKLASMAGIGQTAVGQSTTAGMNSANNTSNIIAANANAQGAAKIAGANSFSGGLNSISNYWQQQQMLAGLKGAGTTGTTPAYNTTPNTDWYAG